MKRRIKRFRDTSPLMAPVCRALRASGLVPRRIWQHLPFSGVIDFTVAGQTVRMQHFAAEIENSLFWAGYGNDWEATTLQVWAKIAAESTTIFDVGANTGLFALAAAAANPKANVHAFEPMPAIVERLRANIALNGFSIELHPAAVSDSSGSAQIRAMQAAHEYSASFEHMEWMEKVEANLIDVPVMRLADLINQTGQSPNLIKLDVERHEPQALKGLWPGLAKDRLPVMLIEVLDDETAAAIWDQLAPFGYKGLVIREGIGLSAEPFRAVPGTMNWLVIPPDCPGIASQLSARSSTSHAQLMALPSGSARPNG